MCSAIMQSPTTNSPLRPSLANGYRPDWRWAMAGQLARQFRVPRFVYTKDLYLGRIMDFIRRRNSADGNRDRLDRLRLEEPVMDDAYAIHAAASYDRWLIEALVVAGVSREQISQYHPASVELLELYEAAYFDVRDLLKYPGFVPVKLLGPMCEAWPGSHPDLLWKKIAWIGGPDMLLRFIGATHDLSPGDWSRLREFTRTELALKSMEATMAIRPNPDNALDVLRTQGMLEAQAAALGQTSTTEMEGMVQSMFAAVNNIIGDKMIIDDPGLTGRAQLPERTLRDEIADYVLNGPDGEQVSQ